VKNFDPGISEKAALQGRCAFNPKYILNETFTIKHGFGIISAILAVLLVST